jgi:hypothetical protein
MSEKELGRDLLKLDAATLAAVPDARQQTWNILARDRRRVRVLTGMTVCVWLLAALLVLGGLIGFGLIFPMQAKLMTEMQEGKLTPAQREGTQLTILMGFQKGTLLIAFSVAVMSLTAVCTVFLILASRRATLRQVNASLIEISEQLKQLRSTPANPPQGATGAVGGG